MADDDATATEAQPEPLGDFELLNTLGGGGMGTVYRARQISMNREVAVKILHEHLAADTNFVDRFDREAHASGALTHPNIIRGIAAGKVGKRFYFAMEFVDGETAAQLLNRRGPLPVSEVAAIGLDMARALQHAHSRHIVHRDIKPSNIMIDREGVVKLADLGLAKAQSDDSSLTRAGGVYGTPAYMAPEQVTDAANADQRSDIYALGVTLYELLTGAKPFLGSSLEEALTAKRSGVYRPIRTYNPAVPEALERIIDKMMRAELRQRFQSAAEVVAAFEATGMGGSPSTASRAAVAPHRSRAILGLGSLGLVLLAALVVAVSQHPLPWWKAPSAPAQPAQPAQPPGQAAPDGAPQVTLGVMLFQIRHGSASDEWKRDALRDKLNAQLSGLSHVKVYSKEFIDFLITRKGLTEIEAATQLGIKKMLSGSVDIAGGDLQIETHVVDVVSGVLEASYTTSGSEGKLDDLSRNLAMETIARIDLPVTDQERHRLLAQNENTNADALKLLLEAEGGHATQPSSSGPRSDAGAHPRGSGLAWLSEPWVSVAWGADEASPESAVKQVLEHYRDAVNARDIKALAGFYSDFSKQQEDALERYFASARELRVSIDDIDVAVVDKEAVVSFTRTDDFVDPTGQARHLSLRLTKQLRNEDGGWKLVPGN